MELNDDLTNINRSKYDILNGKKILLGITGSIAAYKAVNLCSMLKKAGSEVYPVLTENALNFINPITLSSISNNKVIINMFENNDKIYHISLPQSSDIIVIAPASANTISKIANGICDNFLTTAVCAATCPILIAPAMNEVMWLNPILQENVKKLKDIGSYFFSGPTQGDLACGTVGIGRFEKEEKIVDDIIDLIKINEDLKDKKVLITAGGTKENIDTVRYISNYSSGKMGYALAMEAVFRGAKEVILISASKNIQKVYNGKTYFVNNTQEMKEKVLEFFDDADIIIMSAAVSDVIPEKTYDFKLKKSQDIISKLSFKENENILNILASKKKDKQILVGFAAESGENLNEAINKINRNKIDFLIVNDISRKDIGFDSDYNEVYIINKNGDIKKIPKQTKRIISREIFNEIIKIFNN